jgi:predicted tellurium resistance membrane protein TerC
MFSTVYLTLFLLTTLYAVLLEWLNRRLKLDLAWLEVIIGVSLVLLAAGIQARTAPPADWRAYERMVVWAFVWGGAPIVLWQVGRLLRNVEEVLEYDTGRRDADRAKTLAEDRGVDEAGGR